MRKNVKDENGNKRVVEEQAVVYWSRKFQLRAERENKKFLEFLPETTGSIRRTSGSQQSSQKPCGSSSKRNVSMKKQGDPGFF
ncbi:MAG: hypothetical protein ACLTQL_09945 [Eisenbergiella sp.]